MKVLIDSDAKVEWWIRKHHPEPSLPMVTNYTLATRHSPTFDGRLANGRKDPG